MTTYNFSDTSTDEPDGDESHEPTWYIQLHMAIEHLDLSEEKIGNLHRLFKNTLTKAEQILELKK